MNIVPALDTAMPNRGTYLNDADLYVYPQGSTECQEFFYGSDYPTLRSFKDREDLELVLHAHTAVGSEG